MFYCERKDGSLNTSEYLEKERTTLFLSRVERTYFNFELECFMSLIHTRTNKDPTIYISQKGAFLCHLGITIDKITMYVHCNLFLL